MALNIIFGGKNLNELSEQLNLPYVYFIQNETFKRMLKQSNYAILTEDFPRRVMREIDRVVDVPVKGILTKKNGDNILPEFLSQGSKTLISIYANPNKIYRATMGENCIPFVEELSQTKEVYLMVQAIYRFPFKHITEMNILNYTTTGQLPSKAHNLREYFDHFDLFMRDAYTGEWIWGKQTEEEIEQDLKEDIEHFRELWG